MKYLAEYYAAPNVDRFREVDAHELASIIHQLQIAEKTEAILNDIDCATRAAELMDSKGATILVAQDKDGFYFATQAPNA